MECRKWCIICAEVNTVHYFSLIVSMTPFHFQLQFAGYVRKHCFWKRCAIFVFLTLCVCVCVTLHHYLGVQYICISRLLHHSASQPAQIWCLSLPTCPPFLPDFPLVIIHHMSWAKTFSHSSGPISHIAVILMGVCPIGEQELTGEGYQQGHLSP